MKSVAMFVGKSMVRSCRVAGEAYLTLAVMAACQIAVQLAIEKMSEAKLARAQRKFKAKQAAAMAAAEELSELHEDIHEANGSPESRRVRVARPRKPRPTVYTQDTN